MSYVFSIIVFCALALVVNMFLYVKILKTCGISEDIILMLYHAHYADIYVPFATGVGFLAGVGAMFISGVVI